MPNTFFPALGGRVPPVHHWLHLLSSSLSSLSLFQPFTQLVMVWPSGSVLLSINEVNLRRARLVLGWVTVSGFSSRCGIFIPRYVTSHLGQLSLAIPSCRVKSRFEEQAETTITLRGWSIITREA